MDAVSAAHAFFDAAQRRDFAACRALTATGCVIWNGNDRVDRPVGEVYGPASPVWTAVAELRYASRRYRAVPGGAALRHVVEGTTTAGTGFAIPVTARLTVTPAGLIGRIEEHFDPAGFLPIRRALAGGGGPARPGSRTAGPP